MITDEELACYKSNYEMLFQELDRLAYEMDYEASKILEMLFHVKCDMKRGKVVNECVETDKGWQELKPCPFCWSTKVSFYEAETTIGIPTIHGRKYYGVYCYECGGRADNFMDITKEQAAGRWNRRSRNEQ